MKVVLSRIDHCTVAINGICVIGFPYDNGHRSGVSIARMPKDMMDFAIRDSDLWAVHETGETRIVEAIYAKKDTRTLEQIWADIQRLIDEL